MHRPELADKILHRLYESNSWITSTAIANEFDLAVGLIEGMIDRISTGDRHWVEKAAFSGGRWRYQLFGSKRSEIADFLQSGGFSAEHIRMDAVHQKESDREALYDEAQQAIIKQSGTIGKIYEDARNERIKAEQSAKSARRWTVVSGIAAAVSAAAALIALLAQSC